MLTKTAMELIAQHVGASHEDAQFKNLMQSLPPDQARIRFCPNGHELPPTTPRSFRCSQCEYEGDRAVTFTRETRFQIENGELFHYSVGAVVFCQFAREQEERVLLLRRAIHPVGAFTIPSGHWDVSEDVLAAAQREVTEETGLEPSALLPPPDGADLLSIVSSEELVEEECRSGSNFHFWHFYRCEARPKAAHLKLRGDKREGRTGENDMIGWIPVSQITAGLFWLTKPAGHFLAKILDTRMLHVLPR